MRLYLKIAVSLYVLLLLEAALIYTDLWSVYHLAVFPRYMTYVLAAICLALLWMPVGLQQLSDGLSRLSGRLRPRGVLQVLALLFAALLFVISKSENHLLGDGYQRLASAAQGSNFPFTEYLDAALHHLVYNLVGDAEWSYLLLGVASGILFLIAVRLFVWRLTRDPVTRAATLITIIGVAQIQFFFGYAESYTIMTAFAALFIYFGFRSVFDRRFLWFAVGALIAAALFHVSALCFLPGLICIFWIRGSKQNSNTYMGLAALIAVACVIATVLLYGKLLSMNALVELRATENKLYSMFSVQHLFDIANLLLLVAPLPLIVLIGSVFTAKGNRRLLNRRTMFLFSCLVGGLAFMFIAEPNLGAVRDWDMLSIFGLPAAFLGAYAMTTAMRSSKRKHVFLAVALAVVLMHTVPWLVSNASQERTVEHLKRFIADDVHYSPGHLDGARLKSWGYLMEWHFGDIEEHQRALLLRLEGRPDDVGSRIELVRISHMLGNEKLARSALAAIKDYTPKYADRFKKMIILYIELGDLEMAAKKLSLGIEWFPDDPDVYFLGGAVGQMTGDLYNAAMLYQMGVVLSPKDKDMILNYAEVLLDIGEDDDAREMIERASRLSNLTAADRGKIAAFRRRIGN